MRTGWYKEVQVKGLDSHVIRALLASRGLLVRVRRDLENQLRGLLKNFGVVAGKGQGGVFTGRIKELVADRAELGDVVQHLLKARHEVCEQIAELDRRILALARTPCPPPGRDRRHERSKPPAGTLKAAENRRFRRIR